MVEELTKKTCVKRQKSHWTYALFFPDSNGIIIFLLFLSEKTKIFSTNNLKILTSRVIKLFYYF
jgi:hypothetical protein